MGDDVGCVDWMQCGGVEFGQVDVVLEGVVVYLQLVIVVVYQVGVDGVEVVFGLVLYDEVFVVLFGGFG